MLQSAERVEGRCADQQTYGISHQSQIRGKPIPNPNEKAHISSISSVGTGIDLDPHNLSLE